jgi:L,D-transpeptidase catalytic domain
MANMRRREPIARRLRLEQLVMGSALLLLGSCRSGEKDRALAQIEEARRRLASLAPTVGEGLGRQSISLARESLLDAEGAVRREWSVLELAGKDPEWMPRVRRALDSAEIARWVVERDRRAERETAEAWLDAASGAVRSARASRLLRVHYTVQTRVRTAEQSLAEAERLLKQERFSMAIAKAQEAVTLAGELPPETKALFDRFRDPANRRQWGEWVRGAVAESGRGGAPTLVVDKHAQLAVLWSKGRPARWLDVELGYNGLKRKLRAGDGATPEGRYHVVRRKSTGETKFYKALLLDYPNEADRKRFRSAKAKGEVGKSSSIGGLIEIHGEGGRGANWTDGCIAVTNDEMDRLFEALKVGSTVVIVGSYDGIDVDGGPK